MQDNFFSRGLHNNGTFLPWHRGYIVNGEIVQVQDTLAPVISIRLNQAILFSEINGNNPTKYPGERRSIVLNGK